ncbi:c-type cytochrome [Salibaculum griseiflavum]|uniref:Cytochrome C n=1 Tax=Salibaculum griseiflavum TaxID=1914409 RepID=A0A2V1P395_9RHOB|nr:c-type cytochrome [Salibaculum griseiflavum]PWG16895.1 cytochrome C [Salibaculum griseiflavum]
MVRRALFPAILIAGLGGPVAAQVGGDPERGEVLFRSDCASCHQVGQGARNRVGPHLNGIFDRQAGQIEDFRYSEDMMLRANAGLKWDFESLDRYIENPRVFVSRTRMNYAGMESAEDRSDLLAYLRLFSADPANIPEAAPTAAAVDHEVAPEILAIVGDPAYGEYLSTECTSCHQESGAANGIPSITNWPADVFVTAMHAYKEGVREHNVMEMMASRLSNEEIAALAAYFENIE